MNSLIFRMMNRNSLVMRCLFIVILFQTYSLGAQNINMPNKEGPMGLMVNTFTGNMYFSRTDVFIPGVELELDISFSYNAYNFDLNRGFGNGWSFGYDMFYFVDTSNNIVVSRGDGSEEVYRRRIDGSFQSPLGFFNTLSEYEPNKFSLQEISGITYYFEDDSHKGLTKIATRNNNSLLMEYTGNRMTSITNNFGQSISFSYNVNGQLASVIDAIATPERTWTYEYDADNNLTKVIDPLGAFERYTYLPSGPIQTVSDKNLNVVDIVYFKNFAVKEMVGCNKRLSFSYDSAQALTVVTDYMQKGPNRVTKYYYKEVGGNPMLSSISGNCCGIDVSLDYDSSGNVIKETDANGNVTLFTYDVLGNMLTTTNALGGRTTFTYVSGTNLINSIKDAKGGVTQLEYDQQGNMIKITDPENNSYNLTYDAFGKLITSTNSLGNIVSFEYDDNGNMKSILSPDGDQVKFDLSPRNRILSITDGNNGVQTFKYDVLDRLTEFTDALDNSVSMSYDAMGNPIVFRNKKNIKTTYRYDASNRIKEVLEPGGVLTKLTYDEMDYLIQIEDSEGGIVRFNPDEKNQLSSLQDADGNEMTFHRDKNGNPITVNFATGQSFTYTYDKLDRPVSVADENGVLLTLDYDENDNIISYSDAFGAETGIVYDKLERIRKVTNANGKMIEITYDADGQITEFRDESGKVNNFEYDHSGRMISHTDPLDGTTTIEYDALDNIISLTDANNHKTNYEYDALNRVIKETFPDGKYTEYTYDAEDNVVTYRGKDGRITNYTYDSLNRLTNKILPDGQQFSYVYNPLGRVVEATNDRGTTYFTYDPVGRLASEQTNGKLINYTYDFRGRTQTIIYPDSTIVTKDFDSRNRVTSIQKNYEPLVSYEYDKADRVKTKTYGNGLTTNFQYDILGRLISIRTGDIQDMTFTYDDNGNVLSIIRSDAAQSEFFTYDDNDRLINYKVGAPGGPFDVDDTYSYDAIGNRTSAVIGGKNITYTTNSLNQIISQSDGVNTINFTYDENGNLTFDGRYHKTYDPEKRLLKDSASPTEIITYEYDVIGRRTAVIVNGVPTYFTFSGLTPIEKRDANDHVASKTYYTGYLHPIAIENNEIPYYYHQNQLLSVESLSDLSGDLIESYRYDVYGKQSIYDATGNLINKSVTGNYLGFTGQLYDSATGHNQFFFRSYNPKTGIFNQQDLIGYEDGMAMYQYVGNNPANGLDILGLEDCDPNKKTTKKTLKEKLKSITLPGISTLVGNKSNKVGDKVKEAKSSADALKNQRPATKNSRERRQLKKARADANLNYSELSAKGKLLEGAGVGLSALDLGMKAKANYNTQTNPNATSLQRTEANLDVAASGGGVLIGLGLLVSAPAEGSVMAGALTGLAILGVGDMVSQLTTGKDVREHLYPLSDQIGNYWGNSKGIKEAEDNYQYLLETRGPDVAHDFWMKRYEIGWYVDLPKPCPPQGTRKRPPHNRPDQKKRSLVVSSLDPNEIIGPEGQPDLRWVSVDDRLPYTVTYENDAIATAPAKYVQIIVPAHEKMDPTSFHLSGIGFNDLTFEIPAGTTSSYRRLDATADLGLYVDMTAGYDITKNEFFWEFQSIDPQTMMAPDDPMKGFLLQQDTTVEDSKNGHGFVTFSIKPMADAQTLDSILARADIVFDLNDTIPTNVEKNVIDAVAPTSHLSPLNENYLGSIPLSWSGVDDPNGSGVDYYSIYYSTDGTNFILWQDDVRRTDTVFSAPGDQRYFFFVLATDSVGNTEKMRANEVLNTYLNTNKVVPLTWLYFNGYNKENENILDWATTNEQQTKEFIIERSFDAVQFDPIGSVPASGNTTGNTSYSYTDHDIDQLGESIMYYRIAQVDLDGRSSYSNIIRLNYQGKKASKTIVYPNPTKGIITLATTDESLLGTIAQVYDEAGKLLQSVKVTSASQQFNLSGYTNGIYFIQLANKEVMKVIKQ